MKSLTTKYLLLTTSLILLSAFCPSKAQTVEAKQILNYHELKGLLSKHKATVVSILGMERFKITSSKERPESTIYAFGRGNDSTQILIRVRKSDERVSEIAWDERPSTLGNLTHEAINDGFVPVGGNSRYYNRFQKMALFINYKLAKDNGILPCILRTIE
ncbi:hypothetical protein WBJ53_04810 [Spirosoma sp. SC4-14]|uniref:hypothetical protein n=1 Tax=Spirosoma sp. SC4-14 TaxID=3128900 RepID=UPI0030D2881F